MIQENKEYANIFYHQDYWEHAYELLLSILSSENQQETFWVKMA